MAIAKKTTTKASAYLVTADFEHGGRQYEKGEEIGELPGLEEADNYTANVAGIPFHEPYTMTINENGARVQETFYRTVILPLLPQ